MNKYLSFLLILLVVAAMLFSSCKKEVNFDTDPGLKLGFSTDTITFDTVFTSVGSSTKILKVYNPGSQSINISSIEVKGGYDSRYRINVDGEATLAHTGLKIAGNDSAFIFVKVTIDPNQQNTPLIEEDAIVFETNGNVQEVQLIAWGQDAYFYRKAIISSNVSFGNDKPHVIYDYLIVDSSFTLTFLPGTQVYMHSGAVLAVAVDASLKVKGTLEEPVVFQGDRLEQAYQDFPGQWGRIWLSSGSINNEIDYAILKNGQVGIHADTVGNSTNPTLKISNTIIQNMSLAGMLFQGSWVEANNCAISSCGEFAVLLNIGGKYDFRHCSIGNYWNFGVRQTPSLVLNNYYIYNYDTIARDLSDVYFGNCIIYGRNEEELILDCTKKAEFNYIFDHCLFRTEQNISDGNHFISCFKNQDPKFSDPYDYDLSLLDISPAIDKGKESIASGIPYDILGKSRTPSPDLGAYEFHSED